MLKYAVWTKRDGYIPVYTAGMVNTRYIPVLAEYADPSTVSRLRVEPPRAVPVPMRHAQAPFPMIRKGGASRASALRRVAPSGANSSTRARARRAAWRDSSRPSPCSRVVPVYGMTAAQHRNTWYGKTDPGINRYKPVFYHTGILPYRHIPSETRAPISRRGSRAPGTRRRRRPWRRDQNAGSQVA